MDSKHVKSEEQEILDLKKFLLESIPNFRELIIPQEFKDGFNAQLLGPEDYKRRLKSKKDYRQ